MKMLINAPTLKRKTSDDGTYKTSIYLYKSELEKVSVGTKSDLEKIEPPRPKKLSVQSQSGCIMLL